MNSISETFIKYHLLQHPFYLAWNEGKLTREQLALYACEYGSFINLISQGWNQIGQQDIAEEEIAHYQLWKNFAASVGADRIGANLPAVKQLVRETQLQYSTYASALGALYAFEAQQPATATSKLNGLRTHYSQWNADETYFKVHENDLIEPAMLEEKIKMLNASDYAIAASACATTCKYLWDALSGVMDSKLN